jgi:hypothetical protein
VKGLRRKYVAKENKSALFSQSTRRKRVFVPGDPWATHILSYWHPDAIKEWERRKEEE